MRSQPEDLDDGQVAAALRAGWDLDPTSVEHLPVGFGSHHWDVVAGGARFFVSANDLGPVAGAGAARGALDAAMSAARALSRAGLEFVVPPMSTVDGGVLHPFTERYAGWVQPFLDGATGGGGAADRRGVVDLLVSLHAATEVVAGVAAREDFRIAGRDTLVAALDDVATPWTAGPYAEPTRRLLAPAVGAVRHLLARHDAASERLCRSSDDWVITHGEPKPGNLMVVGGRLRLVDWDTALVAPAARDLWLVGARSAGEIGDDIAAYEAVSGRRIDPAGLELYRLRWALCDIASFVADLRSPHRADANTEVAWSALSAYLEALAEGRELDVQTG